MLVRIARIGSGIRGDEYRVPFPTWTWIADDNTTATPSMIVDIPAMTMPEGVRTAPGLLTNLTVNGKVVSVMTKVPPGLMNEWYTHLDNVYKEHSGQFRHTVQ